MAYDLLIRNGRVVDGSGMPSFRADIGVKDGKITEVAPWSQENEHSGSQVTWAS